MLLGVSTVNPIAERTVAFGHISSQATIAAEQVAPTRVAYAYTSPSKVEAVVREYFADIPIMVEIARCESTFRHKLADGSVLRGFVDNDDTGVMQINLRYHQAVADRLGLNLEDIYDNMAYARFLYEREGTRPWNASAPCWSRHLAMR